MSCVCKIDYFSIACLFVFLAFHFFLLCFLCCLFYHIFFSQIRFFLRSCSPFFFCSLSFARSLSLSPTHFIASIIHIFISHTISRKLSWSYFIVKPIWINYATLCLRCFNLAQLSEHTHTHRARSGSGGVAVAAAATATNRE